LKNTEEYETGGTMKAFRVAVVAGLLVFGIAFAQKSGQEQIARSVVPQSTAQGGETQGQESVKEGITETQPQDFNTRCHAAGVVVCEGFDRL
jgi:hypothetical protein